MRSVHVSAREVESFRLNLNTWHSDMVLQAKGSNMVLLTDGNDLNIYTVKGELISSFKEHLQPITSVCVVRTSSSSSSSSLTLTFTTHRNETRSHAFDSRQDDFRVVTASRDLSLRVLTWKKDGDKGLTLESQYNLLGGSHSMSRYGPSFITDFYI